MRWSYEVVGFLGGDFGLAVAARNSAQALGATGRLGERVQIEIRPPPRWRERIRNWARRRAVPPLPGTTATVEAGSGRSTSSR